jgi:DNA polymerase III delta prime subunit
MASIHTDLFSHIVEWAKKPVPRTPASLFLYGPPGIGKTTLARAALECAGYRVVEWNASQHRHKAAVEESLIPLLNSRNVADFFRPEGPRNLGLVLDEIDGMSVGDKGGLAELVRILKDYNGENAIICISNEWMEKKFQPFMKISAAHHVAPPTPADVERLIGAQFNAEECVRALSNGADFAKLGADLLAVHGGDLRKILQNVRELKSDILCGSVRTDRVRHTIESGLTDAHALTSNRIRRAETIKTAVGQLLRGALDMTVDVPLNNNDLNLAGLHLHETLPSWIRKYVGNNERGYNMYRSAFQTILASDRLDYYTFFFQHWTLFPITYQAKLQSVNQILFGPCGVPDETSAAWGDDAMEYTAVLSKQSMLYNQFRYLCEMRDFFAGLDASWDAGFDSAFWRANLYCVAGRVAVANPGSPGHGKKVGAAVWENAEFWRGTLPRWLPGADPTRFMRLLQALEVPRPAAFV